MIKFLSKFNELNLKFKFIIVSIIPAIILLSMTIEPIITLYKGTEVSILVNAYYSSDSFRGKNLYIRYKFEDTNDDKISSVIKDLSKDSEFKNVKAYIVLKKDGEIYDMDYISLKKPKDKLYLNCSLTPYYIDKNDKGNNISANINCNLDKFFISEDNYKLPIIDESNQNENKWSYIAKIKIYQGYGILTDVKLRK